MFSPKYAKLDALFSEFVRKRAIKLTGGCERCLSSKFDIQKENGEIYPAFKQLQCSHFIGRSRSSVRFDPDNACGLCGACHLYLTAHPLEHTEFFKQRLGRNFDLLMARMRIIGIDQKAIELYLKEQLKLLEE